MWNSGFTQPTLLLIFFALMSFSLNGCVESSSESGQVTSQSNARYLVIVVDGLRPDYVTEEYMPNVFGMGQNGVIGKNSYAVFPSYTRPNRSSIPTGVYPHKHGVINNGLLHPEIENPIHTGNYDDMHHLAEVTGSSIITAPAIGEILDQHGKNILTIGHGSWLLNYQNFGKGWMMANHFSQPDDVVKKILAEVGEAPPGGRTSERTAWEVDLYLYDSLGENPADVVLLWLGETDAAGHEHGVGAPGTLEAVSSVDKQIGRILEAHEKHGLTDQVNIFITSDHGFTQNMGHFRMSDFVRKAGLEGEVEYIRNMVYVRDGDDEKLSRMVEVLHRSPEVGAVYTLPDQSGSNNGQVAGTLSTDLIMWTHERSADIIASPAWNDDKNEFGWRGTTTRSGVATHGSDSPYDMNIAFVAFGPDIKNGVVSNVPTGNVDFAPTILYLMGIFHQIDMDGRILHELLETGPDPDEVFFERLSHPVSVLYNDGFEIRSELVRFRVDSTFYIRKAITEKNYVQSP